MAEVVLMEERASKGIVHDYHTNISKSNKSYNEPTSIYKTLMDMTEIDPVLFTACSLTADMVTYKGYDFLGENERTIKEAGKRFNTELDFDKVIKNIIWQLIVYGDAYLEVRWNETKTKVMELSARDTTDIKMDYDKHGEMKGYVEVVAGKGEEDWIHYSTDEMIPFHLYQIGSQIYSRNPFKAIARDFATGIAARDYVHGIFTNLPPKIIYFLKNANDKQRKDFIQNLIISKRTPGMDVIAQGEEFDAKVASLNFEGLREILDWNQKRIIMITRVPSHWMGMLEGANRGIGESVTIPFESKVKTLQHEIASQVNKQLMPKLKYTNLEFKWNAISLLNEKEIIEMMQMMKAIEFDGESIIQFGRDHGVNFKDDAKIEIQNTSLTGGAPQIQDETAPSRMRKGENSRMESHLDSKGVSAEGKIKLDKKKVSA